MRERIYKINIELTEKELAVTMRALQNYSEDWRISEATYEIIQAILSKLEGVL